LREEFGAEPILVEGGGGIFDVTADGTLVFSKHSEGRFPELAEVFEKLRLLGA
jgi:selT/selW/selH-like putative selenoprotein